jgi:hypothetical protein
MLPKKNLEQSDLLAHEREKGVLFSEKFKLIDVSIIAITNKF